MTPKLLLVAISIIVFVGSAINADHAIAQAKPPDQSQSKPSDKPQVKPSDKSQPTRPRVTFFEQEQKFSKDDSPSFGNENFLQSALSGTTMAIEDPAKLRPNGVTNFNGSNISSGSSITGSNISSGSSITVGTYATNITAANSVFSSSNGNITFGVVSPSSALTGNVPLNGTINGQSLTGNYNYIYTSAPIVYGNSFYYPVGQLSNSSQSLVFKILAQPVETGGGSGDFSAPASVSIGTPRDR